MPPKRTQPAQRRPREEEEEEEDVEEESTEDTSEDASEGDVFEDLLMRAVGVSEGGVTVLKRLPHWAWTIHPFRNTITEEIRAAERNGGRQLGYLKYLLQALVARAGLLEVRADKSSPAWLVDCGMLAEEAAVAILHRQFPAVPMIDIKSQLEAAKDTANRRDLLTEKKGKDMWGKVVETTHKEVKALNKATTNTEPFTTNQPANQRNFFRGRGGRGRGTNRGRGRVLPK